MTANTYGRQVIVPLTNKLAASGTVIAGDVVVIDTTNNDAFTTTTSAGFTGGVGIAQESIANGAVGRVLVSGYAALVNVNASVTRGNFGKTHTVAKQATDAGSSRGAGTFCQFLTGGTTPDAMVYPVDLLGSSLTNPMTTTGDIIYSSDGSGTPARLAVGAAGKFLSGGSTPAWGQGPLTTTGDLLIGATGGTPTRLAVGAASALLKSDGTTAAWQAAPVAGSVSLTSGNITTTSTTFVDLTGATVTLTTLARRVQVNMLLTAFNSGTGNACYYDIAIDGTLQGGTSGLANESQQVGGADDHSVCISFLSAVLSAGSHTIKIQWKVSAGTGTTRASSVAPLTFSVCETLAV